MVGVLVVKCTSIYFQFFLSHLLGMSIMYHKKINK